MNPLFKRMTLGLFVYLTQRDAQGVGHPFAVCRVGIQAVADVAELNLPRRTADRAGGVAEERFLLVGAHQAEE